MLADDLKEEIRRAYQQLIDARGLVPRWGQRQMIAEVANALGDTDAPEPIAVVEAGTGTGKTIAYAIAAIPIAKARAKTLVISTATVALQEQLIQKDLPDLLGHSGLDFSVELAKGRSRYVCLQKLDTGLSGAAEPPLIPLYPDEVAELSIEEIQPVMSSMLESLGAGSWDGDLDAWPGAVDEPLRRAVTTDRLQCGGRRCAFIDQCSFFRARDGLENADVVVANHNLVLADLKLGGGAILPPPEDCIYVFDEGHQLAEKCLDQFTLAVRCSGTVQALRDTAIWLEREGPRLAELTDHTATVDLLTSSCRDLEQQTLEAAAAAEVLLDASEREEPECRFEFGVVPESLRDMSESLERLWQHHSGLVERIQLSLEAVEDEVETGDREWFENQVLNVGALIARAESQLALWQSYAGAEALDEAMPWVRWLRGGTWGVSFLASPVLARDLLREHIWQRAAGVVMTSATLSSLGSFDRLRAMTGLPDDARYKRVESPFDAGRAVFAIPSLRSEPNDPDGHTEEIIGLLPELIADDIGALVLFSSRRQMDLVCTGLTGLLQHELLIQDTMSKAQLLERHRDNVDRGRHSALVGLASFSEGIDLPGAYCAHVVIAKLPFAVPDSPRDAAHAELIEQQGGNPFMEISVPDAALKLVQASGRLLRTETDAGRITLLDKRLQTKRYGRAILDSLPRFQFDLGAR